MVDSIMNLTSGEASQNKRAETYKNDGSPTEKSVLFRSTMMSLVFVGFAALVASAFGSAILPKESVVHGGLLVGPDTYRGYDRKLGYGTSYGQKYGDSKASPYQIAAIEHDIKHQLVQLEKNLAAARPYLAFSPQILREAEEQLRALQHIHASRLLHGIESIRQLEVQQEVLIHKVNEQLENSVKQLKHLSELQHEISHKQKSPVREALPETIEASRRLTAQLHAIEAAKVHQEAHGIAKDPIVHGITEEVVNHAIAKDVKDRAIVKGATHHAIDKEISNQEDGLSRTSGVSSDEGMFRESNSEVDPRATSSDQSADERPSNEEDQPIAFELPG